ncbi:MAG: 1,2-phenylacetyl-CoA epoxidase subunit PaaD [Chloroflexota bacterium]
MVTQAGEAASPIAAVAGARPSPLPDATRRITTDEVRELLRSVADPEIPTVSIVDLGMVEAIEVGDEHIDLELLPTFVGCPAQQIIRDSVIDALAPLGIPVRAEFTFRVPWTSDRISPLGRERLAASGFAPPAVPAEVRCPYCRSARVAMDSAFGPTQCRSLFYCRDCRQPFEAFKPV